MSLPGPSNGVKHEEGDEPTTSQDAAEMPPILIRAELTSAQLQPRLLHKCEYCDFVGMTDDKLTGHRETKHGIFLCRFCKAEFRNKFAQHRHFVTCDKLILMRKKVRSQVAETQNRESTHVAIRCMHQSIKCPICKKVFKDMFELGDRSHVCKSYTGRLYQCSGCKANFSTAGGLKSHLISKYTEKDYKCFNKGVLSFESMKIPKFKRNSTHMQMSSEQPVHNPVTLQLVPIKSEPTDADEMHDDRGKRALVAAHLLSDHEGSMTGEYYKAMRRMMYKVNCPFCGIMCRTHAALHSHGLIHHPPHERCLYQCGGCHLTYQTPTGLGQHLKREFDLSNAKCYNRINLVRKQDYLGPVTSWNKKMPRKNGPVFLADASRSVEFHNTDVKPDPDAAYEQVVKKEEPADDNYPSHSASGPSNSAQVPPSRSIRSSGVTEVKEEPEDDYKPVNLTFQ